MGLIDFFKFKKEEPKQEITSYTKPEISYGFSSGSAWAFSIFNGEKTLGSIGPVTEFNVDNKALRTRGWEAYLTNETVQTIIGKMVVWVIGRGLKLQSEPSLAVLLSENIDISKDDIQVLSDKIEALFNLYKEQEFSDATGQKNLSRLESTAFKNAKIGGDVLVLICFDGKYPSVKLIDGAHVKSPQGGDDWNPRQLANGNRIINGVEMDESGTHIAYHMQDAKLQWQRIECRSKTTGLKIAYLVGGMEYRLDYARAMSAISGVLEVLSSMDRYKIATLATAEETSKVAYQIKHGTASTGENPIAAGIAKARDIGGNNGTIPVDSQLKEMANKVAVSTNKQVINNVVDSEVKPIEKNNGELYFKDFYSVFFDIVCSAVNMPPDVAMSKYNTSFSSARAAIKDWEHTLIVERYNFSQDFLKPIYEFWMYVQARRNVLSMPGYLDAFVNKNRMVVAAYTAARWVGDNVPHIDPLKEVKAVREMLGPKGANLPLIDHEGAVERLDNGNASSLMAQFATEVEKAEELGLIDEEPAEPESTKEGE